MAHISPLHFQNAWTNFHDFRHTLTPFYSDDIRWFYIQQIQHTKLRHLPKINNLNFASDKCLKKWSSELKLHIQQN